MKGTASETSLAADINLSKKYSQLLTICIGVFPFFWLIGLGGGFMALLSLPSALFLMRVRLPIEAALACAVSLCIFLSVPIGVIFFGFEVDRVFAVVANVGVWVVLAGGLTAARHVDFTKSLARSLVVVAIWQGTLTVVASVIYPRVLPIPLLGQLDLSLPGALRSFADSSLYFPGWLGGTTFRSDGLMGNATWAGAFAALALLVSLANILKASTARARCFWAIGMLASSVSVYLSLSRSTYILLAGALVVLVVVVVKSRSSLAYGATVVFSLLSVLGAFLLFSKEIADAFEDVNDGRAGSGLARDAIYTQTLDYIRQLGLPLLGFGIKPQEEGLVASVATHSTYLGLLFRAGLLGVGLFSVLLAVLLKRVLQASSPLGSALLIFITIWLVFADIDPGHLVPLFLVLAVGLARWRKTDAHEVEPERSAVEASDRLSKEKYA